VHNQDFYQPCIDGEGAHNPCSQFLYHDTRDSMVASQMCQVYTSRRCQVQLSVHRHCHIVSYP
jgi:hypothetical protein